MDDEQGLKIDHIASPGARSGEDGDLTKGSVRTHMWRMAVPAGIGLFFNTMFNVIDTFWAGAVSTEALAALSIGFPVFFVIVAMSEGVSTAASALISYHLGRDEHPESQQMGGQVCTYAIWATIFLMIFGISFAKPVFLLLGAEGIYLDYALEYIYPIFWCSSIFVASSALNGILLARGNVKVMRDVLVWGFLVNCLLDPWLLLGGWGIPAMGVRGIAIATVLVKAIGLPYQLWSVLQLNLLPEARWRAFLPSARQQIQIFSHSFPAAVNMMTIAIGMFVTTFFIQDFGFQAVAAYGICIRIEQLALLPTYGIYLSILALVGQNYGAGNMERITEALKLGMRISLAIMTVGAVAMYAFPEVLIHIFSRDPEVIKFGVSYLRVAALISWSYVIASNCISMLQGVHRPYFAIVVSLFRQVFARIICFWAVLSYTSWGIQGIWWSMFGINWIAAILTLLFTGICIGQTRVELAKRRGAL